MESYCSAWTDRIGLLGKPQLAQHSYRRILAFLRSPHAGMKQYECGRTQPLLRMGHDYIYRETSGGNLKG
jgi:hypothetical protein